MTLDFLKMSSLNLSMSMSSNESGDSMLYGVDYSGRVWCYNSSKNANSWSTLPTNNRIDIKVTVKLN